MTTTPDAVAAIAQAMADAEDLAAQAKVKLDTIPANLDAIHDNGDAGQLIVTAMSLRAKAIGSGFKADVYALHSDMTEAAKMRNIDLPQPFSGGPR